jgi:transposase
MIVSQARSAPKNPRKGVETSALRYPNHSKPVSTEESSTVLAASRRLRISDDRLWRLLKRVIETVLRKQDLSGVRDIALDETSWKKGHNYVTLVFDYVNCRLIFGTEGKGSDTIKQFGEYLETHGGKREQIKQVCCDMSPSFINRGKFPQRGDHIR